MTQTTQGARARVRGPWPRWDEPVHDRRDLRWSVTAGLTVTVVVHLLIAMVIPWETLLMEPRPPTVVERLQAVEYLMPEPEPPERFVETNPDAAAEPPEESDQIAAQDQRAAQEEPDPLEDTPLPQVDGESEEAHKIIEGEVFVDPTAPSGVGFAETPARSGLPSPDPGEAAQLSQAQAPSQSETDTADAADMERTDTASPPDPDSATGMTDLAESTDPDGLVPGAAPEQQARIEQPVHETFEVVTEAPSQQPPDGRPVPEARPRIQFRVPPGPLMRTPSASGRMGMVAIDAKFSEFGEYQQRMIEAISAQWHIFGNRSKYTGSDIGTRVVVHFTLTRQGEVDGLEVVRSSSSRAGTLMVVESIESRAPFGPWTREMVRVLGESQTVRITFLYR